MPEHENTIKDKLITGCIIFAALLIAMFMIAFDITKRAEHEFKEGEKFYTFYKAPDIKKQYYNDQLINKKITEAEYEMYMEDNALKNAYVEYQTVIDLFTPPESKWVKLSRARLQEITPIYNAWIESLKQSKSEVSDN